MQGLHEGIAVLLVPNNVNNPEYFFRCSAFVFLLWLDFL